MHPLLRERDVEACAHDGAVLVRGRGAPRLSFRGHGMRPGERLRDDWFPTIFQRSASKPKIWPGARLRG